MNTEVYCPKCYKEMTEAGEGEHHGEIEEYFYCDNCKETLPCCQTLSRLQMELYHKDRLL